MGGGRRFHIAFCESRWKQEQHNRKEGKHASKIISQSGHDDQLILEFIEYITNNKDTLVC